MVRFADSQLHRPSRGGGEGGARTRDATNDAQRRDAASVANRNYSMPVGVW